MKSSSSLIRTGFKRFINTTGGGVRSPAAQAAPAAAQALSNDLPELPPCDFTPPPYKGPSYEDVGRIRKENLTPALLTYYKKAVLLHQGHMQYLWDHEGKRYLDLIGGMVSVGVGHCHPKVVNALDEQIHKLWHTTSIWWNPQIHEYAEKFVATLPGDLKVVYFVNSGTEANELAIMMARLYTGAYDLISLRNGYHGGSPQVMAMTSMSNWRFKLPLGWGVTQTMNPDPYKGPWGGNACRDSPVQADRACSCAPGECYASRQYVDQLKDVIKHCTPKEGVAGFFAESIQGGGGTVQYPKGFLKNAFEAVREQGGLCISDEVQTSFYRTGEHFWGFEGHDVIPDIVTTAKSIGNGFPLAAVVTTPKIAATMGRALHFNTFGGNPMACVVGSAVLDVLEEDGCQKIAQELGTYLLTELAKLRSEFEIVGDVRGKGLLIGIEMVTDKESKEALPQEEFMSIWESMKLKGILPGKGGLAGNVFRIKPPMCITKDDADFAIAVIRRALTEHVNGIRY